MDLQFIASDLTKNCEAAMTLVSASHIDMEFTPRQGGWDAAQHFEHLALFNDAYLLAMTSAADKHRQSGQLQSKARGIGIVSKIFLRMTEPPVRMWMRASSPAALRPAKLPLSDSFHAFLESHERATAFLARNQELDLGRIYFVNPFVKGLNFSLSTCLLLIAAHERRHFWEISRIPRQAGP
jgi:hypothetical protein